MTALVIALICATMMSGLAIVLIFCWAYRLPLRFVMHYPYTKVTRHRRVRPLLRWLSALLHP